MESDIRMTCPRDHLGKNPISLVDTRERTTYTFSYGVISSNTSRRARYNATNVLPVPAAP